MPHLPQFPRMPRRCAALAGGHVAAAVARGRPANEAANL